MFRKNKINVAIIGATGFTGLDLVYLLSKHSQVKILYLCATKNLYAPTTKQAISPQIEIFMCLVRKNLYVPASRREKKDEATQ